MKVYKQYFTKTFIASFALLFLFNFIVFWFFAVFKHSYVFKQFGLQYTDAMQMSFYDVPSTIVLIMPFSLTLSVALFYQRLAMKREFLVWNSFGLSKLEIFYPVLVVTVIILLFTAYNSFWLSPISLLKGQKVMSQLVWDNVFWLLGKSGEFYILPNNFSAYSNEIADGQLYGTLLYQPPFIANINESMVELKQVVDPNYYESLIFAFLNNIEIKDNMLVMRDGIVSWLDIEKSQVTTLNFAENSVALNQVFSDKIDIFQNEVRYKTLRELFSVEDFRLYAHVRVLDVISSFVYVILTFSMLSSIALNRVANSTILARSIIVLTVEFFSMFLVNFLVQVNFMLSYSWLLLLFIVAVKIFKA